MSRLPRSFVIFVLIPALLCGAAYLLTIAAYTKYTRGGYEVLVFLLIADLGVALRGAWRDVATLIAATIFGLAAIELACAVTEPDQPVYPRGFSISRPILGWGPSARGVYHSRRMGAGGTVIYDVDYTIGKNLLRPTQSGSAGPSVAFFGDSMTFGQGLPDSETLPQIYADLTSRKVRVLNFGFPGYGPQQFLRSIETGLFDPLLGDTKTFVFETAAWHAERAACRAGFVTRAPRYELRDDKPVFVGACAQGLDRVLRDIFISGALYQRFVRPLVSAASAADVDIYVAELERCAELVKEKYGGHLVVIYIGGNDAYLAKSGFTDASIEKRLRQAGVDVVDATLAPKNFPPGTLLTIPGDGHPTAIANRARAALLKSHLENLAASAT
jgi:hypothetical protein